jgi:hypothetical protein
MEVDKRGSTAMKGLRDSLHELGVDVGLTHGHTECIFLVSNLAA